MFTILLINIIAFTTWMGFKNPGFMDRMRFSAYAVKSRGELHRVISSALVHANWTEFIWLALALFFFGRSVEGAGGAIGLYLIFAWGIIGGNPPRPTGDYAPAAAYSTHARRTHGAHGGAVAS